MEFCYREVQQHVEGIWIAEAGMESREGVFAREDVI